MYRVYFTQVFEAPEVNEARNLAASLIKETFAGVVEASAEIVYVPEE